MNKNRETQKSAGKTNRERVMDILQDNSDTYMSGESISENLEISRASVWKHISSLKKEGYEIESKAGTGYRLVGKSVDRLTAYDVKKGLETGFIGQNFEYFETIDSTNTYAGKCAENSPEGTVIAAGEQTAGRGRTGRKWISKSSEGIYFSLILKPEIPVMRASFLTQVAGGALVEAFEEIDIPVKIKWPNDIILNGRKICGILTEMKAEIDRISYVVVGIGINLIAEEFDEELEKKATSLAKEGYRVDTAEILRKFFEIFERRYIQFINGDSEEILKTLREKSAVIGREIYVVTSKSRTKVYAEDIDDRGNLIVREDDGTLKTVYTGEISIRGLDSYI